MSERFLLVSDLDDTLLGDDKALAEFRSFVETMAERLTLVYCTGRFYPTVVEDIDTTDLPAPAMIVGGVGSEMRTYPSGDFHEGWRRQMSEDWSAEKVLSALASEAKLTPQPTSDQSEFKASFYCSDATPEELQNWQRSLEQQGVRSSVVYSSGRDLDFLPAGVDKGAAAAFVAQELGFAAEQVVVSGNSGNDSKMFEHSFAGIIVANADPELKRYASRDRVLLASKSHASGVVEGLRHWMKLSD